MLEILAGFDTCTVRYIPRVYGFGYLSLYDMGWLKLKGEVFSDGMGEWWGWSTVLYER